MFSSASKTNLSQLTKGKTSKSSHVVIDNHYYLKSLKAKHDEYNFYKGIDVSKARWIHIYAKQTESTYPLSSKVKENLRNQICPKVLWAGEVKVEKSAYYFQVHQKYGPSLQTMFDRIKVPPSEKELLHLLLEMLKLVERLNNIKLVSGQLDPNQIIFDANPKKNQLYLLNCFSLKKRNQQGKPIHTKYCSRGAHLGRNIGLKDDLESVCYILIDIFTQGAFLKDKLPFEYQQEKLSEKIQNFAAGLPKVFIDFYNYIISLNYSDQINFFHWKTYLTKLLTMQLLGQPYGFMLTKNYGQGTQFSKADDNQEENEYDAIEDVMQLQEDADSDEKQNKLTKVGRVILNGRRAKQTNID